VLFAVFATVLLFINHHKLKQAACCNFFTLQRPTCWVNYIYYLAQIVLSNEIINLTKTDLDHRDLYKHLLFLLLYHFGWIRPEYLKAGPGATS